MDRFTRRLCLALLLAATAPSLATPAKAGPVTTDDLLNAQGNSAEWLMYGRDYRNQRYSPLDQHQQAERGPPQARLRLLDRRQAGRAGSHTPVPRRRALFLRRLRPRLRGRCPDRHPHLDVGAGIRGRGSTPFCAAARSIAASR